MNFETSVRKLQKCSIQIWLCLFVCCFNETVKKWTDAYTHDWRGFNETREKNLFKSGFLEIDTLNSVDTFS